MNGGRKAMMLMVVSALCFALCTLVNVRVTLAADELCNNKDDDLDGLIDEDFPMVGKFCWSGIGACRSEGIWKCNGKFVVCDPKTFSAGVNEVCDGLDNDCNGLIDDGLHYPGCYIETDVNQCNQGRFICTIEGDLICVPTPPAEEICGNDLDEDCDGLAQICLPTPTTSSASSGGAGGSGGEGGLGTPCRPVYIEDGRCSLSPSSPHPLFPLSALLTLLGGFALAYRRTRLR